MSYGSLVMDGTEQTLVLTSAIGDAQLDVDADFNAMAGGDTIVVNIYKRPNGANFRLFDSFTLSGAQTYAAKSLVNAMWHNDRNAVKVTLQQTAGTYRTIPWETRAKV